MATEAQIKRLSAEQGISIGQARDLTQQTEQPGLSQQQIQQQQQFDNQQKTQQKLKGDLSKLKSELSTIDKQREDRINSLRDSRGNIDINVRKRINREFQQKAESVRAKIAGVERAIEFNVITPGQASEVIRSTVKQRKSDVDAVEIARQVREQRQNLAEFIKSSNLPDKRIKVLLKDLESSRNLKSVTKSVIKEFKKQGQEVNEVPIAPPGTVGQTNTGFLVQQPDGRVVEVGFQSLPTTLPLTAREKALASLRGELIQPNVLEKKFNKSFKRAEIKEPERNFFGQVIDKTSRGGDLLLAPFSTIPAEVVKESGEAKAVQGVQEFFGGRKDLLPFEEKGTAVVTERTPLTKSQLLGLPFSGGTREFVRRTESEAERVVEFESDKAIKDLSPRFEAKADKFSKDLERKLELGLVTKLEAQKLSEVFQKDLESEFNSEVKRRVEPKVSSFIGNAKGKIKRAEIDRRIGEAITLAPLSFAGGLLLGGIGSLSRGVGIAGNLLVGSSVLVQSPKIISSVREAPIQTLTSLGITTAAFGAGSVIGARLGTKSISKVEIEAALSRARVKTDVVSSSANAKQIFDKYNLSPAEKSQLQTLLDRGFSAREIKKTLIRGTAEDSKLLPKVEERLVELLSRDGQVIETVSLGKFVAVKGKKIFSRDILEEAVGKLDDGGGALIRLRFEGKLKKGNLKRAKEVRTLEEFRSDVKADPSSPGIQRLITGESKSTTTKRSGSPDPISISNAFGRRLFGTRPNAKTVKQALKRESKKAGDPDSVSAFFFRERVNEFQAKRVPVEVESGFIKVKPGEFVLLAGETSGKGGAVSSLIGKGIKKSSKSTTPFNTGELKLKSTGKSAKALNNRGGQVIKETTSKKLKGGEDLNLVPARGDSSFLNLAKESSLKFGGKNVELLGFFRRSRSIPKEKQKQKQESIQIQTQKPSQLQALGLSQVQQTSPTVKNNQRGLESLGIGLGIGQVQAQQQQQQLKLNNIQTASPSPGFGFPVITPTKTGIVPFGFINLGSKRDDKVQAYNVQIKRKGSYRTVNKKPLDRSNAISLGAKRVDSTPSAQFRISSIKNKKIKKPKKVDPYYVNNQFKFRQFTVSPVRGKKRSIPKERFIEKRAFRFDLGSERKLKDKAVRAKRFKSRSRVSSLIGF